MKRNSLSLILLLSVLLLITLSFTAFQTGQISALESGIEAWQDKFEELEAVTTSALKQNDRQLTKLDREIEETKRQQERLRQSCGEGVQPGLFVRR